MPVRTHDALVSGDKTFKLRAALSVYYGAAGALVMAHDVHLGPEGEAPQLTAGYPLTREAMDALARGILGHAPTRGLLPPEVLLWDGIRLAWWAPSKRRRIWFNARQQRQMQHVSRREVTHPALLFVAEPGHLWVWALAESARPTAETPVHQAPYLNVYPDGNVCAGAVEWPPLTLAALLEWEAAWYDSEGAHATASELTRFPGGHDALWTAMRTAETFPADSLVPTGLTVLDAVNREGVPQAGPAVRETIIPAALLAAAGGGPRL